MEFSRFDWWQQHSEELREVHAVDEGDQSSGGAGAVAGGEVPRRLTMTVEEAAQALGISRAFAYEAVRRGDVPSVRIGRRILIPRSQLEQLLGGS